MKIKKFIDYNISESIVDISQFDEGLEKSLITILYNNVESGDTIETKQFITRIENEEISDAIIEGLSSEQEWFDFYLKFKDDIDVILTEKEWFNEKPSDNNLFSLYSIVVEGTQYAVLEKLKEIKDII